MAHVDFIDVGEYAFFGGTFLTAGLGIAGYQTLQAFSVRPDYAYRHALAM